MGGQRIGLFETNILRARELVGLGQSIAGMTFGTVDASDLYRSGLVQGIAALDTYVHGVVLDYGVEIVTGSRAPGKGVSVGLTFGAIGDLTTSSSPVELEMRAKTHLSERLSKETFQRPDSIAKGFSAVGVEKIWKTAFGEAAESTVTSLGVIVARRNQIVHSCDMDQLNLGTVVALTDIDAVDSINTVDRIVQGIDRIL